MKKIILMVAIAVMATTTYAQTTGFGVRAGVNISNAKLNSEDLSPSLSVGAKTGFYVSGIYNIGISESFGIQAELGYALSGSRLSAKSKTAVRLAGPIMDEVPEEVINNMPNKTVSAGFTNHNFNLPILARYTQGGLSVLAGPYFSYTVATNVKFNDNVASVLKSMAISGGIEEPNIAAGLGEISVFEKKMDKAYDKAIKKFDLGFTLGAEYAFENGLFVDVRYNQSLLNTLNKNVDFEDRKVDLAVAGSRIKLKTRSIQIGVGYRF